MLLAASVRGRAASSRSMSLRRSIARRFVLRPAREAPRSRARDKARSDDATAPDVFADGDRGDELGSIGRLRLFGHRQQTGDAAAFPVILPSRRSSFGKPPEIGERQGEQPLGPDRRRQGR